jgi:hypothetical protein
MSDQTWFILREPGCVPQRKGPFRAGQAKAFLLELMECRPHAFITVLLLGGGDGPVVEDAPEWLEIADGRYRHRARRHRASSAAAFAAAVRK